MADPMAEPVVVTRRIAASPERVWALITDVTRMGEWSPETTGCRWIGKVKGPEVGARFVGQNRNRKRRWATPCVVTESSPGRRFGFRVNVGPIKIATWTYDIAPTDDGGCVVTESTVNLENKAFAKMGDLMTNVENRAEHNRATMAVTLDRLAAAAESA